MLTEQEQEFLNIIMDKDEAKKTENLEKAQLMLVRRRYCFETILKFNALKLPIPKDLFPFIFPNLETRVVEDATLLMVCAKLGLKPIAEMLLDQGAKIDTRDANGKNAIQIAADFGHVEMQEFLLAQSAVRDSKRAT